MNRSLLLRAGVSGLESKCFSITRLNLALAYSKSATTSIRNIALVL